MARQDEIMELVGKGITKFLAKDAMSIKALQKKGLITYERVEKVHYITAFKEYVIHGQYRTGEYQKKTKLVLYIVEKVN